MKENKKDTVVITGASAGLGRAVAVKFASHGARVAQIAGGQERLEDAKREIEGKVAKPLFSRQK